MFCNPRPKGRGYKKGYIMIGETILHYKILEKLGEGGMGVVYKAQDTKLNRTVALKFLPDRVNQDEAAKKRFLQEAQAVAALNHSNICTIHGIEESDGSLFMIMEYVDGGTLSSKIPFGKINDALETAVEVGEALQEAHSKGIVHRDIKADNIMLTSKGQAKVMDFGLAKLKGALKLTKSLKTVGTLGYMSPEQIQGGEVDNRSDIFSFGVLLFEMLTGNLPFRGEHEAAVVYSVVNEEPQDISKLVPDLSSLVVNLIQRCLEKDPDDRYQTMKDAVSELKRSMKKSSGSMAKSTITRKVDVPPEKMSSGEQTISTANQKSFLNRKYIIGLAAIVVVGIAVYLFLKKGTPELNQDMTFRTIQMPFTVFQYPGLSSDGNWIVFPAADANNKWDIYWMHNSGGEARRVTFDSSAAPPVRALGASISPDGSQIAYTRYKSSNNYEICVVSSNGGIGRKIADGTAVKWRPDGKRIGYASSNSKYMIFKSIRPDGSDDRTEFIDSLGGLGNYDFAWSPDGNSIAWLRTFPDQSQEIIIHNLKTGQEKQLTFDGKHMDSDFWTANNMIIFSSNKSGNTNLWCISADGGKEQQITRGSGPDLGMVASADCKRLLYYQNQTIGYIWRANSSGSDIRQLTFDNQNISSLCLSPDGQHIVFSSSNDQGFSSYSSHIYVMNKDGSNRRQLTFGDKLDLYPVFSPDGKYIAYSSRGNLESQDSAEIKLINFPSSGEPRTILSGNYPWWIDDSSLIVLKFKSFSSWKVPVTGGKGIQMLKDSMYACPIENGKYIVYTDLNHDHRGYWLYDEVTKTSKLLKSSPGPTIILPKAGFAYYTRSDDSVWKIYLPGGKEEELPGKLPGINGAISVAFSADGKNIAFINTHSNGRLVMVDDLFK